MKEKINITDYANLITKALPKGILLNTNGDKFNSVLRASGTRLAPTEPAGETISARSGAVLLSMCMSDRAGTQRGSLTRPGNLRSVCH